MVVVFYVLEVSCDLRGRCSGRRPPRPVVVVVVKDANVVRGSADSEYE